MQSGCINVNIAKAAFRAPQIDRVSGDRVRYFPGCSLILCIINAELNMLTAKVNAPPPLNKK